MKLPFNPKDLISFLARNEKIVFFLIGAIFLSGVFVAWWDHKKQKEELTIREGLYLFEKDFQQKFEEKEEDERALMKKKETLIEDYKKALEGNLHSLSAQESALHLVKILKEKGFKEDVVKLLEKKLPLMKKDHLLTSLIHIRLGTAYMEKGEEKMAKVHLEEALKTPFFKEISRIKLALLYVKKGDLKKASKIVNEMGGKKNALYEQVQEVIRLKGALP